MREQSNKNDSYVFELYSSLLSKKKTKRLSGYLILGLCYAQIFIYTYQTQLEIVRIDSHWIFSVINDFTFFVDISNLKDFSEQAYVIACNLVMYIGIIYFLLFLLDGLTLKYYKKFKWLSSVLRIFANYYSPFLLLPTLNIQFSIIFCKSSVMEVLDIQCYQGDHMYLMIGVFLSIILISVIVLLNELFYMNFGYFKKDYLAMYYENYQLITLLYIYITGMFSGLDIQQDSLLSIIYSVYAYIFPLMQMGLLLYYWPYNRVEINKYVIRLIILNVAQGSAFQLHRLGITDPILSFILVIGLLYYCSNNLMYQTKIARIGREQMKSYGQILRKSNAIMHLTQYQEIQSDDEILLRGCLVRHITYCQDIQCFCKRQRVYDSKSERDLEWGIPNLFYYKRIAIKFYQKQIYENYEKQETSNSELLIGSGYFLFYKFKNLHLASIQLTKASQFFLYPTFRYKVYALRQMINKESYKRNVDIRNIHLEYENVIFIEDLFNKVVDSMKLIVQYGISYWQCLSNELIDLKQIEIIAQQYIHQINMTEQYWKPLRPYLENQKTMLFFYEWYLRDFQNKRIIISNEELNSLRQDNDLRSVDSRDFINNIKERSVIFEKDCCVIHISGNIQTLGKILKYNKAVLSVFDFSRSQLDGQIINNLMPEIYAKSHNRFLMNYIETGKSKLIYNQINVFGKNGQGYIFPIWLSVKQLCIINGDIEYIGLMKPIKKRKEILDYILLDKYGQIDSVSSHLSKKILITPKLLEIIPINILLLSPKLIKYFYYNKYTKTYQQEQELLKSSHIDNMNNMNNNSMNNNNNNDVSDEENNNFISDSDYDNEFRDSSQIVFQINVPSNLEKFAKEFNVYKKQKESTEKNINTQSKLYTHKQLLQQQNIDQQELIYQQIKKISRKIQKSPELTIIKFVAEVKKINYNDLDGDIICLKIFKVTIKEQKFHELKIIQNSSKNEFGKNITQNANNKNEQKKQVVTHKKLSQDQQSKREQYQYLQSQQDTFKDTFNFKLQDTMQGGASQTHLKDKDSIDFSENMLTQQKDKQSYRKTEVDLDKLNQDNKKSSQAEIIQHFQENLNKNMDKNPFLKEDNLFAKKQLVSIFYIKWFIRVLFTLTVVFKLISLIYGIYIQFSDLDKQFIILRKVTEYQLNIYTTYNSALNLLLLEGGYYSELYTEKQIELFEEQQKRMLKQNYEYFVASHQSDDIRLVYLDRTQYNQKRIRLGVENEQFLEVETHSSTEDVKLDDNLETSTKEQSVLLINSINQIYQNVNELNLDVPGLFYLRENMFQHCHEVQVDIQEYYYTKIQSIIESVQELIIYILIIENVLFFVSFIIIFRLIIMVCQVFQEILESFAYIDTEKYIKKIEQYLNDLSIAFQSGSNQYDNLKKNNVSTYTKKSVLKSNHNQQNYKKAKRVNPQGFMASKKSKIFCYYIFCIFLTCGLSLIYNLLGKQQVDIAKQLLDYSDKIILQAVINTQNMIIVKENFMSPEHVKEHLQPYLVEYYDKLESKVGVQDVQIDDNQLQFQEKYYKYYLGNPCEQLSMNTSEFYNRVECEESNLKIMQKGLIAFRNYYENIVIDHVRQNPNKKFGELNPSIISNLDIGVRYSNYFTMDIFQVLENDFKLIVQNTTSFLTLLTVLIMFIILILYFISEKLVAGSLNKYYKFYRKLFNLYMPQEVLIYEKRIQAKLVKSSILDK